MAGATRTFYCLRCQHRFPVDFDPQEVVERSCPKCGSNSVRLQKEGSPAKKSPDTERGG